MNAAEEANGSPFLTVIGFRDSLETPVATVSGAIMHPVARTELAMVEMMMTLSSLVLGVLGGEVPLDPLLPDWVSWACQPRALQQEPPLYWIEVRTSSLLLANLFCRTVVNHCGLFAKGARYLERSRGSGNDQ